MDAMKDDLQRYLQAGRDALVWKLEGASDYDVRRPLVPTGTNLLGLVKHLASVEYGYFGVAFDRPPPEPLPWWDEDADVNADMWATPDESTTDIIELYRRAWRHADETITANELGALGTVPWWPADRRTVSLHRLLVHVIAETHRHAGHADIVRELVDGSTGLRADATNLPDVDDSWWDDYRDRLQQAAERFLP